MVFKGKTIFNNLLNPSNVKLFEYIQIQFLYFQDQALGRRKEKKQQLTIIMGLLDIEKMMAVVLVFHLITVSGALTTVTSGMINNVTVGAQILFPFDHLCSMDCEVMFQRESPLSSKIASWMFKSSGVVEDIHPIYKERVKMEQNSSLMLHMVQKNDSGSYSIEINHYSSPSKASKKQYFRLHVFEKLSQPVVVKAGNCSTQNITLSCSVSNGSSVVFHWEKQSLCRSAKDIYNGRILVIDNNKTEEQYVYVCIAENPVSKATSDPVKIQSCSLPNSKDSIDHQKQLWMFSAIGASIFLVIMILIIKNRNISSNELANEATQENNEDMVNYEHELIEPTYTTRLETRTF